MLIFLHSIQRIHAHYCLTLLGGLAGGGLTGGQALCALGAADLGALLGDASLLGQLLLAAQFALLVVDGLHEHTLGLVAVTLDLHVQLVVQVLVDLLALAVLLEHAAQDAHAADPEDLDGQTRVGGTLALTGAGVAALLLGIIPGVGAGTRVHSGGALQDHLGLDQLAHRLAGVGHRDLIGLTGVQVDGVLTALED